MKYDNLTALNLKSAEYYGYDKQSQLLVEECSELIQAVCKYNRYKNTKRSMKCLKNLVEEVADVEIMLEQIKAMLNITEEHTRAWKAIKVKRTQERIVKEIERKNEKQNNDYIPCIEYLPDK